MPKGMSQGQYWTRLGRQNRVLKGGRPKSEKPKKSTKRTSEVKSTKGGKAHGRQMYRKGGKTKSKH